MHCVCIASVAFNISYTGIFDSTNGIWCLTWGSTFAVSAVSGFRDSDGSHTNMLLSGKYPLLDPTENPKAIAITLNPKNK